MRFAQLTAEMNIFILMLIIVILRLVQRHVNRILIARHCILEKVTLAIMNVFQAVILLHINFRIVQQLMAKFIAKLIVPQMDLNIMIQTKYVKIRAVLLTLIRMRIIHIYAQTLALLNALSKREQ